MGKAIKRVGIALGVVVALAALGYGAARWSFARASGTTYVLQDPPLLVQRDAEALAQGAHLFATRGCADCHGKDAAGRLFMDAGPVGQLHAPNLTRGGKLATYGPDAFAAAVRHGVREDGRALLFMPVEDFMLMSDADVAAIYAWLETAPPSAKPSGVSRIKPLGHVLFATGRLPLFPAARMDHAPRPRPAPPVAPTVEYGRYLAQGCTGCHGSDFGGQHVPGTPAEFPDARNLTPAALGTWTQADFRRALREGKRPDGAAIDPFMPWKAFAGMTDVEVDALWAYLQTVPPRPTAPTEG
jgi:mono/diheme cytochrome c family protein